jgi:selenocysteine-specific elongation factor
MYVIGTAGHIDHGKSVLVRALTGIDPDRLPEEKARGMTIDLGFAWLILPSGREVSIVDVPGHERFVKNMLAGGGGIDMALLVIAADEGVMPQTREHLAILDLLQVRQGIVVITKKDLVDEELLELVTMEVKETVTGTTLSNAPVHAVSGITGEGLAELLTAIDRILDGTPPKKDIGRPRLPIDRVFTMAGFGTVVTGTLIDGTLSVGQELEILPAKLKTRIRGLQTHKRKTDTVSPGNRVAVNLAGMTTQEMKRGYVATTPGWLKPTRAVDVSVNLLASVPHPLRHNATVTLHTGSSEVISKIRLLDREILEPGQKGWAQLVLSEPIAAVKGDLFIIRSSQETLGGGEIVALHAKRHRRFQSNLLESLSLMEKGGAQDIILSTLEQKQPIELGDLSTRCNLTPAEVQAAIQILTSEKQVVVLGGAGSHALLMSTQGWERLVKQNLQNYHRRFPLRQGMPKDELRSRLKIPPEPFLSAMEQLVQQNALINEGTAVRLPSHRVQITKEQQATIDAFLKALSNNPYSPPSDMLPEPQLLDMLIERRQVVKVSDKVVFAITTYNEMVNRIVDHIKAKGKINVGEVKEVFGTSRMYAIALLEHLDAQKITKRTGDERVLYS